MNKLFIFAFLGLVLLSASAKKEQKQEILAELGPACTPYFTSSNIEMTNGPSDPVAGWYLAHCKVQNPQAGGAYVNANSITWTNANQGMYYHQAWACVANGQATMYYPNNCTWSSGALNTVVTGSASSSSYQTATTTTTATVVSGQTVVNTQNSGVTTSASQASGVKTPSPVKAPSPTPVKAPSPVVVAPSPVKAPSPSPVKAPSPVVVAPSPVKTPSPVAVAPVKTPSPVVVAPPSPVKTPSPPAVVPQSVVATLPIPPKTSLPPSPVVVKQSSVPAGVTVVTIPGTTLVVVPKSSVPSLPSSSIASLPPSPLVPETVVQSLPLPPASSLPSSPVVVKSSSVPSGVSVITISGTTLVIVPASSVTSLPSTSVATIPTGLINTPAVASLAGFSPSPYVTPSPSTPPVVFSRVPSTLPPQPIPTVIANFPSSQLRVVNHQSTATQHRVSIFVVPSSLRNIPTTVDGCAVSPPQPLAPSTWRSPVFVPVSQVTSLPWTEVQTVPSQPGVVVVDYTNLPSSVPSHLISTVPTVITQLPSTIPIIHATTVVIHGSTTYYIQPSVSSNAPPGLFVYTLQTSHTVYVRPSTTVILPSSIPASIIPTEFLPSPTPTPVFVSVSTIEFTVSTVSSSPFVPSTILVLGSNSLSSIVSHLPPASKLPSSPVVIASPLLPSTVETVSLHVTVSSVRLVVVASTSVPRSVPTTEVIAVSTVVALNVIDKLPSTLPASPVLVAKSLLPSSVHYTAAHITISSQTVVIVASNDLPSSIHRSSITYITSVVAAVSSQLPHSFTSFYITPYHTETSPSQSWSLPPASQIPTAPVVIPGSLAPASHCVFVLPSTTAVIISSYYVPTDVPNHDIETVHVSSLVITPTVPHTLAIPDTFTSPVVAPWTAVASSVHWSSVVPDPTDTELVVVPVSWIPSTVPTFVFQSVPSDQPTFQAGPTVPYTLPIPDTFTSPVVAPWTAVASSVHWSSVVPDPTDTEFVVVPVSWIPSSIPSASFQPVPSDQPSFPVAPTVQPTPLTWLPSSKIPVSPVLIPAHYVSSFPSSVVVTIPHQTSVIVVPNEWVPSTIPSIEIVTVPSPVPNSVVDRCVSIISHYSFATPVAPSTAAFLA